MKNILFTISIFLVSLNTNAQKELNISLKYDANFERYEVFAKPNFSQKKFIWGPSQISVVIPSNVLIEKIKVRSLDGGVWEDNSIVIAPEVKPELSFHGISSGGDKAELVENHESILFYFTLPKDVNPASVRLFDNKLDPKSNEKGMLGGDFRNTIVDISGEERFTEAQLSKTKPAEVPLAIAEKFQVSVFPNIVRNNKFNIALDGIEEKDGEILMILSDLSGKEVSRNKMTKSKLEQEQFNVPAIYKGNILLARFITSKGSTIKRIISDN
jgi:hypothetical protein